MTNVEKDPKNTGAIIQPGQKLYLCYQGDRDKYVATVYPGARYWFPTVGSNRIELCMSFRGTELGDGAQLKIITTEDRVGSQRVLGAFSDAHECYYWDDTQGDKQLWQVTALGGSPDKKIRYGQRVALNNLSWATQRLVAEGQWLTTREMGNDGFWIIEKA
jgi:hypothetical protein